MPYWINTRTICSLNPIMNGTKKDVRRNIDRFPSDFMFELTRDEYNSLRSQIVTLEEGRGKYSKHNPFVFTEQGQSVTLHLFKKRCIC